MNRGFWAYPVVGIAVAGTAALVLLALDWIGLAGLPVGLLASSAVIGWIGYPATVSLYVAVGVVFTAVIGARWRRDLWR